MPLIERYLAAVGLLLPSEQRADITAELRDVLMTRLEEQQAELGRPLTDDDEVALLRAFGDPVTVAARYAGQHYLVGPELYPHYVFMLKLVLVIVAIAAAIIGVVSLSTLPGQPGQAFANALAALWQGTIETVGVLTIIAAAVQRWNLRAKLPGGWNPRDLPAPPKLRRQTPFDHVAAIVLQTVFVLFWTHALAFPLPYVTYIPLKDGQHLDLALAPVWTALHWPVLGLVLGRIAVHVLNLMGDVHKRSALVLELVLQFAILAVAGIALRAGEWLNISAEAMPAQALAQVRFGVHIAILAALIVVMVIAAGTAGFDAWRLYRGEPGARR